MSNAPQTAAPRRRAPPVRKKNEDGEFLWLMSLSDLMILLFIFFVVMFSFTYKKVKTVEFQQIMATIREGKHHVTPIETIKKQFAEWVVNQKLSEQVTVNKTDDAVVVEIKDRVLFNSGEYNPTPEGRRLIKLLALTIAKVPEPFRIGIEGHTDDLPIHTATIQDNWELSTKRALQVFYAMELAPPLAKRAIVMGYGAMKPIDANRDKNRRVTIRIF
jgi:chemotaxis protein MotB